MSDTPRTDVVYSLEGSWDTKALRMTELAGRLERELAEAQNILKQCLSIMPVGYVPTHTVENLPEMISDLAKSLAEETTEREQLELELAEARERITQHNRSFDGHIYVESEEYSDLCEAKRQRDILANALRHCRLFIVERKGYMSHEVLERQLIKEKIDTALAAVKGYEA